MSAKPKIILVDDHLLFREGMKLLIEAEGMGEVIAEASNGQVFLGLLETHHPDLVLMDIEMPVMGGVEATVKAIALNPDLKILLVTMLDLSDDYARLITTGALGCVLKSAGKQELENAIKTVQGVEDVIVDISNGQVRVTANPIDINQVKEAVEKSGYIFKGEISITSLNSDHWLS